MFFFFSCFNSGGWMALWATGRWLMITGLDRCVVEESVVTALAA